MYNRNIPFPPFSFVFYVQNTMKKRLFTTSTTEFLKQIQPQNLISTNRRVVVTGLGTVNPLGLSIKSSWKKLIQGHVGIDVVPLFKDAGLPIHIGATVKRGSPDDEEYLDPDELFSNKRAEDVDFITFALAAAKEALEDANFSAETEEEQVRSGIALGAGIGSLEEIVSASETLNSPRGLRRLSPYFIPRTLVNLAAGNISLKYNLKGPNHSCITACATGAHSIGDACRFIKFGDADVMVAGGTESTMNPLAIAGFSRIKALASNYNENPKESSRPFDKDRSGFVMGEGAGVLVLEELEHAKKRGANIYCEVRGYGLSGDSYHITAPSEDGDGAFRAMKSALLQSGLTTEHLNYINCHATSTPLGDKVECNAIRTLLNDKEVGNKNNNHSPSISSTKGATGHLLGAAGAVEAIFSILALQNGVIPPTVNLENPDDEFNDLNIIRENAVENEDVNVVLSNSFGFGGTNCSLCFTKYIE